MVPPWFEGFLSSDKRPPDFEQDKFPNVERFFVEASCCLKGVELPPVAHMRRAQNGNIHDI